MNVLLFLSLSLNISIPKVGTAPVIDGRIDSVWGSADSAGGFIQIDPDEGATASESTKVFICCDDKNIYVAFKCFDSEPKTLNVKKVPRDYFDNEDNVGIAFDTFGDKATAYQFILNAGGAQYDEKLSEDGRKNDISWDGVWYSAVKVTDYGYVAEIKIPFKTLRFKKGVDEWGVNFFRYISKNNESVAWAPLRQAEGMRVSRSGTLKGIPNTRQGLNLEVYPVALVRYVAVGEDTFLRPQAGLDVGWGFTSSQVSLTVMPDFAQIEGDPYTINLTQYEPYLYERRPFFIESQEIFDSPITLFYSRRIGKQLPRGEVPILGGAKYTGTAGRVKFGVLSAFTDSVSPEEDWFEPRSLYSAGTVRLGVLKNSDVGFTYSGVSGDSIFSNQKAFSVDGAFRTRELQSTSQVAKSDSGYAENIDIAWYTPRFMAFGGYQNFDKTFDVGEIGYAPYVGYKVYSFMAGPQFFSRGMIRQFMACAGAGGMKRFDSPASDWVSVRVTAYFRNGYGGLVNVYKGNGYDMGREYPYYLLHGSFWTDRRNRFGVMEDLNYKTYSFNYNRWWFAKTATNNVTGELKISPSLSIGFDLMHTFEWTPREDSLIISQSLRPTIHYALTKDIQLRICGELNTDTDMTGHTHHLNALFSYNFRPKSWFYVAFNQAIEDDGNVVKMTDRVAVTKIRYLFFW